MKDKRVNIITLGCPKNEVDSDVLKWHLLQKGYQLTEKLKDSDIILINTCGFIDQAKAESLEEIWKVIDLKNRDKGKKLIVAGCLAQRYPDQLWKEIPEIDGIMGITEFKNIGKVCDQIRKDKRVCLISPPVKKEDQEIIKRAISDRPFAYLRIADGCNNCCSYCTIPLIRGSFRSRSIESLLREAEFLANKGVKEINLIAQDTTLYGADIYGKPQLPRLLSSISEIPEIKWIRLLYTHPAHYSNELIDTIASSPKVCKYLDIPLQHISDKILSLMNRKVTKKKIIGLIEKLRKKIPDLVLRTTFLVGFPSETESDFDELLNFVEETRFDKVGIFAYSREENTKAYDLKHQIPSRIKHDRLDRLLLLQQKISLEKNQSKVGKKMTVLVEGKSEENGFFGRSQAEAPEVDGLIYIKGDKIKIGDFVEVKVTKALDYDLIGEKV
jgi:ribosomal protein S12 methylthiotransferase